VDTKQTFKVGTLYNVKTLSKNDDVEVEGVYIYSGFGYVTNGSSFQHIFSNTNLGVKYNMLLIPYTSLDRYDISEIFI